MAEWYFFFPKAGHTVICTEAKYRDGDLIEHHTEELYFKEPPKRKTRNYL